MAQGILLTTEECLLSEVQQRNPGVSREQLEQAFHDYLGIDQVIWLGRGIAGDDTHGHVDDITRFVGPATIVTAVEPNTSDANHEPLAENLARLKAARTLDGKQFTIVELPMPRPVVFRGQRLPASYANFYIANGLVLVPTFHDPNDRIALGHSCRSLSRSRSHRHPCRRPGLGSGRAALHDAAAASAALTSKTCIDPTWTSGSRSHARPPCRSRDRRQREAGEVPIGAVVVCRGRDHCARAELA